MNLNKIKIWSGKTLSLATLVLMSSSVFAQATFLIWPIYPKIEADEKATAVWLENTGKSDAMVQIRVFKWDQNSQQDAYNEQNDIIPSPPVAKIKAGEKHMLRLTRAANAEVGREHAYRIIVDELPIKLNPDTDQNTSAVSFQMRYSIPLFTYGKGIGSGLTEASQKINAKNQLAIPVLNWWIKNNPNGRAELYIQNTGAKFSRLSGIQLTPTSEPQTIGKTAFGYVLANSTVKFELEPEFVKKLSNQQVLYGIDSSGVQQTLIEMKRGGG